MSRRRALAILVCAAAAAPGITLLEGGCSSEQSAPPNDADAGDARAAQRDAPIAEEDDSGGLTRASCLASCSDRYPTAKPKDDAIQACWEAKCAGRCTLLDGGGLADAADAGEDAGSCVNPVTTELLACDLCTVEQCCAEWDSCFSDEACSDYVGCATRCPVE